MAQYAAMKKSESKKNGTKPSPLMRSAGNRRKLSPGFDVLLHFSLDITAFMRKVVGQDCFFAL